MFEKTETRRLSAEPHHRHIQFHWADPGAPTPGELHVRVQVEAVGGAVGLVVRRAIGDTQLTVQEREALAALLDRLVRAELATAGYEEKSRAP